LIHGSATHLLTLIQDLLDIAKIEARKYRLDEEEISLRDVAQEAIQMVSVAAAHAGLQINEDIDPALPLLRADRRVTKQMLLNLLSNAVKFTPAGGKIAVTATVSPSGLCVVVSDTGIGISRADLPKLAQPFVQVESHLARARSGTGLGLALCRQFAELHAGYLELESQLEIGTTARIVFPAARIVAA
jgi:signal transduction histidine kinase